jgi:hypothetical protein
MNFQKTFDGVETFQACRAAEKWCRDNGISVGAMQGLSPRGLLYGDFMISKWRNMSASEREVLDGIMIGNMRNGPVTVELKRQPIERRIQG